MTEETMLNAVRLMALVTGRSESEIAGMIVDRVVSVVAKQTEELMMESVMTEGKPYVYMGYTYTVRLDESKDIPDVYVIDAPRKVRIAYANPRFALTVNRLYAEVDIGSTATIQDALTKAASYLRDEREREREDSARRATVREMFEALGTDEASE